MSVKDPQKTFELKWSVAILSRGFTMVPNILLDEVFNLGITSSQLVTLIVLERYRWAGNELVFPSYETMAKQSGQSRKTVERCVRDLKNDELIRTSHKVGRSNKYDLEPLVILLDEIARSESNSRQFDVTYCRQNDVGRRDILSHYKDP